MFSHGSSQFHGSSVTSVLMGFGIGVNVITWSEVNAHIFCCWCGTALLACKLLFFWSSCLSDQAVLSGLVWFFFLLFFADWAAWAMGLPGKNTCCPWGKIKMPSKLQRGFGIPHVLGGSRGGGKQKHHSPQHCHISWVKNLLGSGTHRKEAFARWAGKTNSAFFFEMDLFPVLECKQGGELMCTQQKRQHLIFMPVSRHCIPQEP